MTEQMASALRRYDADHAWVDTNRTALLNEYEGQWIAVEGGRVIASAPDLDGLIRTLKDPAHTCVEYITREALEMVL